MYEHIHEQKYQKKISPLITLYMKTETTGEIILPFRILKQGWLAFNIQHLHFIFVKYIYNDTFMIITQKMNMIE